MTTANPLSWLLIALIKVYKLGISPWFGTACRFTPGCSSYMQEAVQIHGPIKGAWLGARRVARCHPWGGSGYDPVPGRNPAAHTHIHRA
jgi:putative membrane protein insertion efficiency factor